METRGSIWSLTILELLIVTGASGEWGFRVQEFEKSPGLFYVDEGTVNLYSTTWKTIVYINLREENIEIGSLRAYIDHVDKLCNSLEIKNWTGCGQFKNSVNDRFLHLEMNADILADIIGEDNGESRWKRGVLNFVGKISKMLFGTLDEDDADYYDEQIRHFERDAEDTTELLKQQVYVTKSTLGALNATLADVAHNDKLVREGLTDIQQYLDSLSSETAQKLSIFEAKFLIEKHIAQVNNALTLLQRNIDLLLDSVLHAQSGKVQPQLVPPRVLIEALRESQAFFPRDTILPFTLSSTSMSLVYKVCDVKVYIQHGKLSYVVSIPLIDRGEFKAYSLIPIPIPTGNGRLVYIKTDKPILCVDTTRQYHYFSSILELHNCKETTRQRYVCKQVRPLISSQVQEECAVRLLREQGNLPSSCELHYVVLNNTVWTQIGKNEWVYYVPNRDSITILCADRVPVDVPLKGAGKLSIDPACKGYSRAALLQPLRSVNANTSSAREHRLAQAQLSTEYCEELKTRVNLSRLNLDLNFRQTVSHADDLRYAGIKVRELEANILEHEWKEKHSVTHKSFSIVLYILIVLICLYFVIRLILCVKSRGTCRRGADILKLHSTPDPTSGHVVNINIKTSNDSLSLPPEQVPLRELPASSEKDSGSEARASRRLRSTRSYF
jgi:hypothetical protein